jgi:hypothetical protein
MLTLKMLSNNMQCDNAYPDCTNCRKAGVECDKSALSLEIDNTPGYIPFSYILMSTFIYMCI